MKKMRMKLFALVSLFMIGMSVTPISSYEAFANSISDEIAEVANEKSDAEEQQPKDDQSKGKVSTATESSEPPKSDKGNSIDIGESANANDSPTIIESLTPDLSFSTDFEFLTVGEDGTIYYNGEPLYVNGDDNISANLEELMKKGVSANLKARAIGSATIEFLGYVTWGYHTVGNFKINGKQAFCIEHKKSSPPTGTPNHGVEVYDNVKIQAILYWGWGGPNNIFGSDFTRGFVATSLALSHYYYGDSYLSLPPGYDTLLAKAEAHDVPNHGMNLNGTNEIVDLPVEVKDGKQVSASATLTADSSNFVEWFVPDGITYVCENTGETATNANVKTYGGQTFHLESDLKTSQKVEVSNLNGHMQAFQPLVVKPVNGSYQVTATWRWYDDPAQTISFNADFYTRTGEALVKKRDDANKAVPGAKFELINLKDNAASLHVTDKDGNISFVGLHGDTYKITEIEAPTGYLLVEGQTQTVTIEAGKTQELNFINPKMTLKTTASDKEDGDKILSPEKEITITDKVAYTNLFTDGREYVVKGTLMDKATNQPILVNGKPVTSEKSFVPKEKDGFVEVSFTLDASALAGKTVVVFERLYQEGKEIVIHADITDNSQTVKFDIPKIGTTAFNTEDNKKIFDPEEKVTLKDTVAYSNLQIGKTYKLKGVLMDKAVKQPLLIDGKQVVSEVTFKAEKVNGTIDIPFTFDASKLKGREIVVFEYLTRQRSDSQKWYDVTNHTDINDVNQTVKVTNPKIGTSAINAEDETQLFDPLEEVTLIDTVSYTDLVVGREYKVTGVLMDKETGLPLLIDGEEVTAETVFTPTTTSGTVEVTFVFDGSAVRGKTIVVFESLHKNDTEIAVHADIEDEAQTVDFTDPEIQTTAINDDSENHFADALEEVTITDTVSYTDLINGKQYTVTGVLMDKETGLPLLVNDEEVTQTVTFIAREGLAEIVENETEETEENDDNTKGEITPLNETSKEENKDSDLEGENQDRVSGTVDVVFTLNAKDLQGKTTVVFETLTRENTEVAVHTDIDDEDQTIIFNEPDLQTEATINGQKAVTTSNDIVIKDTVSYTNLTVGKEYIIKGVLMDKATNKPFLVNRKEVTAEKSFIAESENGTVEMIFTFNGAGINLTKELVVFEDLYRDDLLLTSHADINDKAQTVIISPKRLPQTGETAALSFALVGLMLAMVGLIVRYGKRKETEV